MKAATIDSRLAFKRDWVFDPVPVFIDKFSQKQLAKLAIIQLQAEHAALKAYEEALEEAMEVYNQVAK